MADLEEQQVWRAAIGLDLADRPVLEAEVLIWRIVRQMSTTRMRRSLDQGESGLFRAKALPAKGEQD